MPYGTIKVDNITFTDNSVDKTVSLSGLIQNPTFTGNVTATGTISGDVIRGGTTISGVTVTGTTANFVSGVFTTQISGTTITGTTVAATTGNYTSLTGTTTTGTTANFVSGVFTNLNGGPIAGTRNRVINGDMQIDQRNAGASVTPTNATNTYVVDRWAYYVSQASKLTSQQSTVVPTGFTNSLLTTSSSAYSVGTNDLFIVRQKVEGFNAADLGWGAAGAQSITVSFWVRSSLTGTFGGAIKNDDATRAYPFSYTISSANTWEQKSLTVSGDTTGTWLKNSSTGIQLVFGLGAGSAYSGTAGAWTSGDIHSATGATSVVATSGATFYITGVQLEPGTVATPFERRSYGQELALCQRYYSAQTFSVSRYGRDVASGRLSTVWVDFPVVMRATPTTTQSTTGGVGTQFVNVNDKSIIISASSGGGDMAALASYTASAEL